MRELGCKARCQPAECGSPARGVKPSDYVLGVRFLDCQVQFEHAERQIGGQAAGRGERIRGLAAETYLSGVAHAATGW
jgi:hypothetical protein